MFPDGNGIDLCREIKATHPHTTVVISSSLESVDAWNRSFQAGADDYLEKRELLGLDPKKIALTLSSLVERNRLRRQTEETSRRQAQLMSVLSHDVRAPFQALLGTIEMLRKEEIQPGAIAKVETLYCCVTDQLAFINSLLELLRLESGMVEFRRSSVDLNLPVNQCLQSLSILASKKEIVLIKELHRGLPRVQADMGRISQLTGNLVSNAIKFTPRGGSITVRTSPCATGPQAWRSRSLTPEWESGRRTGRSSFNLFIGAGTEERKGNPAQAWDLGSVRRLCSFTEERWNSNPPRAAPLLEPGFLWRGRAVAPRTKAPSRNPAPHPHSPVTR